MTDPALTQPPTASASASAFALTAGIPSVQYHPVATTRMDVMARLQQEIPKNDYNLPLFFYNPEHITGDFFSLDLNDQAEIMSIAAVPIDYAEGFPTVEGIMLWEKLPFEPEESSHALELYIKLEQTYGYRALALLVDQFYTSNETRTPEVDARKLAQLRQLYVYYAWGVRVKAYDMLHHVAYTRRRERRAIDIEDYHYLKLEKIMGSLIARFNRFTEENWDELNPADATRVLKELAQLQRVAAGLPAHGPQQQNAMTNKLEGASIEQRLRDVAQRHQVTDATKSTVSETEQALREDPQVLAMAQELIMAMAKKSAAPTSQDTAGSRKSESPRETGFDADIDISADIDNVDGESE